VFDAGADGLDDAGTLVAEHHRPPPLADDAVGEMQIRPTDAGGGDADKHLLGARRLELHGLGSHRCSGLSQNCRADVHR
jgi:hypothetical protein